MTFKKGHKINLGKKRPDVSKRMIGNKINLGRKPWNKETKGVMKPNKTSFKKGQHFSPKTEFKKGHKLSEESEIKRRKNISISLMGNINGKGHKYNATKETREKLRKAGLGREFSEKTKKKMSNSSPLYWKDKQFSEDHIKNLKKSHLRYYKEHPEAIEKIKENRAKQVFPIKDTKIEVKIQNFLKTLGVEFFTHQYMKQINHAYQCDVFIPSMNLVIECDGTYWHKYPTGRDIDHVRTSELLEKGFKVLRLWEFEINEMSINEFREKIEKFK